MMMKRRLRRRTHDLGRQTLFTVLIIVIIGIVILSFSKSKIVFFRSKPYISPLSLNTFLDNSKKNDNNKKIAEEKISSLLAEKGIKYAYFVTRDDSSFQLTLKNGEEVLFSRSKPIELQISSLQHILSRLTIEGKSVIRIDLRFDKPVILFR